MQTAGPAKRSCVQDNQQALFADYRLRSRGNRREIRKTLSGKSWDAKQLQGGQDANEDAQGRIVFYTVG